MAEDRTRKAAADLMTAAAAVRNSADFLRTNKGKNGL